MRIDFDDILRQVESNGHDEVCVEFVATPACHRDDLAVLAAAGDAVDAGGQAAPDITGGGPVLSVAGASVLVRRLVSEAALAAWVTAFADALGAGGLAGLVRATPLVRLPDWVSALTAPRTTVYLAANTPFGAAGGFDTPAATAWCEAAVRWAAFGGADTYLSTGALHQVVPTRSLATALSRALEANGAAAVTHAGQPGGRVTRVQVNANGHLLLQEYDPDATPATLAGRARAALLANVAATRLGFVAPTPLWAYEWDARTRALPSLPTIAASAAHVLRDNGAVWHRFVPDAHGMQLLTNEHLRRTADLSMWKVLTAGDGRFLVEARDVGEWLRHDGPSETVAARARAEFGAAIVARATSG